MTRVDREIALEKRLYRYAKMHYLQGMSYAEIGREVGLSRAAISSSMKQVTRFPMLMKQVEGMKKKSKFKAEENEQFKELEEWAKKRMILM